MNATIASLQSQLGLNPGSVTNNIDTGVLLNMPAGSLAADYSLAIPPRPPPPVVCFTVLHAPPAASGFTLMSGYLVFFMQVHKRSGRSPRRHVPARL